MTAQIIDGKIVAKTLREKIKEKVKAYQEKGIVPGLAVILVGKDPASQIYVRKKLKPVRSVGSNLRFLT